MARILVAVAWPYANGPFHLGHLAGAYLPGDIFARYHRLRGDEVLMVSGSDMHGTPISVTAEKEGTSPRTVAERYHAINKDAFERLGFSFDLYTSTQTLVHERTVQEVFLALFERGYIRRRTENAPFCPKDRRFLPDRYLVGVCPNCGFEQARGDECDRCGRPLDARNLGRPACALCGTPAEFLPTEHFYLELDRLAPRLTEYLSAQGHWRPGTLRVAQNFLTEGLHPTAITRDLDWGVPLPVSGYPGKRFYVWFDALIGYLSASREWAIRSGRPEAWHRFWDEREPVRSYYFVGKDNKFHHTIIWPAVLLGFGGLKLPFDVAANEWLLIEGKKLSKSRTTESSPFVPSLLERYSPDQIRFYGALLAPQHHDTELDWAEFHSVYDEVLANQYGNLVQRALVFARDRYAGRIPAPPDGWSADSSNPVGARLERAHAAIGAELEKVRLKEALDLALEEVREANRRFHEGAPWKAEEPERSRIVYETLWSLRALATWLSPFLPFSSAEVYRMLGFSDPPSAGDWERALDPVPSGQTLGEVHPLFPRADRAAVTAAAPSGAPSAPGAAVASVPLAIRAARVLSVSPHPSADRLYVIELDLGGEERRTVVAGLRTAYPEEKLRGKRVVVLANLAPRTIRKMTSQGMILASEAEDRPVVLEPGEDVEVGSYTDGSGATDRIVTHEEFASVPLTVGRVIGAAADGGSTVDLGGRKVRVDGVWAAGTLGVVRLEAAGSDHGVLLSFGPGKVLRPSEPVAPGATVR